MVPSRNGPKGADVASFGLATLVFLLTPTQAGYQDLAALLAQQPAVTARWRDHLVASPFGTIHAATFSMPRPIGTAIPESPLVRLASLSTMTDVTGSTGNCRSHRRAADRQTCRVPRDQSQRQGRPAGAERPVAARACGARRTARATPAERPEPSILPAVRRPPKSKPHRQRASRRAGGRARRPRPRGASPQRAAAEPDEIAAAMHFEPFPEYDISLSLELDPKIARGRGRSCRPRSDRIHAERAAEPRRAQCRSEGDAALFRQRSVRHVAWRHQAVGDRRGAAAMCLRPILT